MTKYTTYSDDCFYDWCEDCTDPECQCDCHDGKPQVPEPFDPVDRSWGY